MFSYISQIYYYVLGHGKHWVRGNEKINNFHLGFQELTHSSYINQLHFLTRSRKEDNITYLYKSH